MGATPTMRGRGEGGAARGRDAEHQAGELGVLIVDAAALGVRQRLDALNGEAYLWHTDIPSVGLAQKPGIGWGSVGDNYSLTPSATTIDAVT